MSIENVVTDGITPLAPADEYEPTLARLLTTPPPGTIHVFIHDQRKRSFTPIRDVLPKDFYLNSAKVNRGK